MSIVTTHDVFCDSCCDWEGAASSNFIMEARKKAKAVGWKRVWELGRYVDVCPACVKIGLEPKEMGNDEQN